MLETTESSWFIAGLYHYFCCFMLGHDKKKDGLLQTPKGFKAHVFAVYCRVYGLIFS